MSERPIQGAAVKILELERVRVTDQIGYFAFDSLPPGTWTFETSQFGYETNTEVSRIEAGSFLLVRIRAEPLELEGLYVSVVQRLAQRRMAVPSRVAGWDREDLQEALAPDIGTFVRTRGVARFMACGGELSENDLPNCFIHRGRLRRVRLFLDDVEVPDGIGTANLWAYDPRDLWAVEFIPACRELRVYTRQFMEWVQEGRVRLAPMLCVP